ncbi:hypothetical protein [Terrarubrum flagellatum]|uniref:hypothetical protein n=1 Tax=Terrirubrum flagellatum TaxID=2895980 RepID=UPI0031456757
MIDPLPPHIWFVRPHRGHWTGRGYYPARREGWILFAVAYVGFIIVGLGVVLLCAFFPRFIWLWLISGAAIIGAAAFVLNGFLKSHGDLSLDIYDVREMRKKANDAR